MDQEPDFRAVHRRFERLDPGLQAAIRRVPTPEVLRETVAIYRLFPQARPHDGWLRVAFLLPWCDQWENPGRCPSFGAALHRAGVREERVLQMARAGDPLDVEQLRRMAIQVRPVVDWGHFGWELWKWNQKENPQPILSQPG